jgi:hypothetical protein
MDLKRHSRLDVPANLIDAIRSFPLTREVEHCGCQMSVAPFDFYALCPRCGKQIKVRAFTGAGELEDVFDAVFEWMNQPGARELAQRRQEVIEADSEE